MAPEIGRPKLSDFQRKSDIISSCNTLFLLYFHDPQTPTSRPSPKKPKTKSDGYHSPNKRWLPSTRRPNKQCLITPRPRTHPRVLHRRSTKTLQTTQDRWIVYNHPQLTFYPTYSPTIHRRPKLSSDRHPKSSMENHPQFLKTGLSNDGNNVCWNFTAEIQKPGYPPGRISETTEFTRPLDRLHQGQVGGYTPLTYDQLQRLLRLDLFDCVECATMWSNNGHHCFITICIKECHNISFILSISRLRPIVITIWSEC